MSYLQPDKAPRVHIEALPTTAVAVDVSLDTTKAPAEVSITTWASGDDMECYTSGEGTSAEDFLEYTCYDCEYHTDQIERDADGEIVSINGEELELAGTIQAYSPCPCYNNGLGDVSFPCVAGHDGPDYDEDGGGHVTLSAEYMRYTNVLRPSNSGMTPVREFIYIQRAEVNDEGQVMTSPQKYPAINCYNNGTVCWGDNTPGDSLQEMEIVYTMSEANEDLTSTYSHEAGVSACKRVEPTLLRPTALPLSNNDDRGKAVVVASTTHCAPAYMIMTAVGCMTNGAVAYIPVYSYSSVAVDDDTVINVWATDVLPTNTRLLFYQDQANSDYNGLFIGQVPHNFNLSPCKSQLQQSSAQAELVSS